MDITAPPLLYQSSLLDKATADSYPLWGANHMRKCMVVSSKVGIISPILQVNKPELSEVATQSHRARGEDAKTESQIGLPRVSAKNFHRGFQQQR